MALTVGLKHQAATGRGRFTQIVGRFEDLRLGTRFNHTIGKPGCIAPGDDQPDGKENQLTHDKDLMIAGPRDMRGSRGA
jgi:hypothetical protein